MLDSLKKRPGSLRWPPRQKFVATERGRTALQEYEEALRRYHEGQQRNREEVDRIQGSWAETFGVLAADATVLSEFAAKEKLPREVESALRDCGTTLADIQAAVDRLYTAGLLQPAGGGGPLPPAGQQTPQQF